MLNVKPFSHLHHGSLRRVWRQEAPFASFPLHNSAQFVIQTIAERNASHYRGKTHGAFDTRMLARVYEHLDDGGLRQAIAGDVSARESLSPE